MKEQGEPKRTEVKESVALLGKPAQEVVTATPPRETPFVKKGVESSPEVRVELSEN